MEELHYHLYAQMENHVELLKKLSHWSPVMSLPTVQMCSNQHLESLSNSILNPSTYLLY